VDPLHNEICFFRIHKYLYENVDFFNLILYALYPVKLFF